MRSALHLALRFTRIATDGSSQRSLSQASLLGLLLLAGILVPPIALADITNVAPNPATRPVSLAQPTALPVFWSVLRAPIAGCGAVVSSPFGEIRVGDSNGLVVMTVRTALSQTRPCGNAPEPFTFTESVLIPADVVQRAQKLGASNLVFERLFSDGVGTPQIGSVRLPVASSAAAGFSVSREALQFDNGAPTRVLARREALRAFAQIDYTGSGPLQGTWEIAGPGSTAGEPIFRPLSEVRDFLAPTAEKTVIKSPLLPTDTTGLYLLRLRITDPSLSFEAPVIRYFVTEGKPSGELLPQPLSALSPPPRALLARETTFAWEPIANAQAYQLEIYHLGRDTGGGLPDLSGDDGSAVDPREIARALAQRPITGMIVSGKQTTTSFSGAARQHLDAGQLYLWRVRAIGANGAIIGESAPRVLRTP